MYVNGVEDPKLIQVGEALIIPRPHKTFAILRPTPPGGERDPIPWLLSFTVCLSKGTTGLVIGWLTRRPTPRRRRCHPPNSAKLAAKAKDKSSSTSSWPDQQVL